MYKVGSVKTEIIKPSCNPERVRDGRGGILSGSREIRLCNMLFFQSRMSA
jgi:hypothetical protein